MRLFTCVFERGIFSYKSIPLLYVKLTLRLRPHGHEGRVFFFFFLYHYTLGRGFLLNFFFGIIELWYLNIFRYSVILKIQYWIFSIFNSIDRYYWCFRYSWNTLNSSMYYIFCKNSPNSYFQFTSQNLVCLLSIPKIPKNTKQLPKKFQKFCKNNFFWFLLL